VKKRSALLVKRKLTAVPASVKSTFAKSSAGKLFATLSMAQQTPIAQWQRQSPVKSRQVQDESWIQNNIFFFSSLRVGYPPAKLVIPNKAIGRSTKRRIS